MSRGLGAVQRFVIKQLEEAEKRDWEAWVTAVSIADAWARQHERERTPSDEGTIRRAIWTLADRGLVEATADLDSHDGYHRRHVLLAARLNR
jgi:hypothetical protein